MRYSNGFKASVVRRVQDGSGRSIYDVARETGVNALTIRNWLDKARNGTLNMDRLDSLTPDQRSPGEKLVLVLEAKGLPIDQQGEWLRSRGLHSEHLPLWEKELIETMSDQQGASTDEEKKLKKRIKELEKELNRKDKALSEAAVLLTLKKKYQHLFQNQDPDEDR